MGFIDSLHREVDGIVSVVTCIPDLPPQVEEEGKGDSKKLLRSIYIGGSPVM